MFAVTPPEYVSTVLDTLHARGYYSCIVGGCVRDAIMGREPNDWDVATSALPEQVLELYPDAIPTGMKHGTVTVRSGMNFVEVTTFRTDGGYSDHRHPDAVSFVGDLEIDLGRRDFTINAIAVSSDGEIADPYHGIDDIRRGIVRCVGSPHKRFEEDALRMLRAFRFSSRLGFEIEPETRSAIGDCAHLAENLSAERVRDELEKILLTVHPEYLYELMSYGLINRFISKVPCSTGALKQIASLPQKALPRWAAFCSELKQEGCIGSVSEFLKALRLDGGTVSCCESVCAILEGILPVRVRDYKQLLRHYGSVAAECACQWADVRFGGDRTSLCRQIMSSGECCSLRSLAVNGDDLAALGLKGREIGEMLDFLLDYVIDYPDNNRRERLMAIASASVEE